MPLISHATRLAPRRRFFIAGGDALPSLWSANEARAWQDFPPDAVVLTACEPSHDLLSNFALYAPRARRVPHAPFAPMVGAVAEYYMQPLRLPVQARAGAGRTASGHIPFEERQHSVVWRGMPSGPLSEDNLRLRIVRRLRSYPRADVAFSNLVNEQEWYRPRLRHGELRAPLSSQTQRDHRAILSISGHGFPSNLVAALSSGSVAVVCVHWSPYELRRFTPWVHYVPVNPNHLDELESALDWIWADTARAAAMAEAAQNLSLRIFNPIAYRELLHKQLASFS